jgi:hypothetical protein
MSIATIQRVVTQMLSSADSEIMTSTLLVTKAGTQTITGDKTFSGTTTIGTGGTITSPTITGPSISDATVTGNNDLSGATSIDLPGAGATRVDVIAELTAATGVTIDGVLLKDLGITVGAGAVDLSLATSITLPATGVSRASQEFMYSACDGKIGTTAGWVVNAADNLNQATLPASQTASHFVIPISGLKVGSIITAFKVEAQIESAGGAVTLDADLRKQTNAAADPTDASIGAITQVAVTADTKSEATKTGLSDTLAADEWLYVLITATTAGSTDIRLLGVTVTVTEK